ncbi:TPA: hypothetical protein DCW54_00270 [Candidatus Dependentiae bacterium]|nr:hypothetical protein [Candidatus Dependentiae bacterium]
MKAEWENFSRIFSCSSEQIEQFELFYKTLVDWNTRMNLTAITAREDVRDYHFADSLYLGTALKLDAYRGLVDIGTGAGFPGIPLKIMNPKMPLLLIEVVEKRRRFLSEMVSLLGLTGIEIISLDWRTFVHTTNYPHNLFCARASLKPEDLMVMFTHKKSAYKRAELIYWASSQWECSPSVAQYRMAEFSYDVGDRKRKYVSFKRNR